MKIIINFSDFDKVQLGSVNNKILLTVTKQNTSNYLVIPSCLSYAILDNALEVSCNSSIEKTVSIFNIFKNTFTNIKENTQVLSKQKLLLKGLGFRSTFEDNSKTLSFKLGYSHLNILQVPAYIKNVKIKKNMLLFEASDKILLGDYIRNIYLLRKSDPYKGKGFSHQYDNKKLKVIKKK